MIIIVGLSNGVCFCLALIGVRPRSSVSQVAGLLLYGHGIELQSQGASRRFVGQQCKLQSALGLINTNAFVQRRMERERNEQLYTLLFEQNESESKCDHYTYIYLKRASLSHPPTVLIRLSVNIDCYSDDRWNALQWLNDTELYIRGKES